ncbi:G-type lectin S-receptor-like serine/threonine-protein kinase RKS1 [Pyrus x bretschneideri]|uniref:G-type lectin S-receptor-like serine/threonine-protein kinase RKS1 n=1 Tax=Pyrus x bretschneideri TaxID=225117 RepID=UPI00203022BB|nr:G-type lectin S-receptor-like serine/threonine-protein kinase RKS1 [Pyrus x bretschneideri]
MVVNPIYVYNSNELYYAYEAANNSTIPRLLYRARSSGYLSIKEALNGLLCILCRMMHAIIMYSVEQMAFARLTDHPFASACQRKTSRKEDKKVVFLSVISAVCLLLFPGLGSSWCIILKRRNKRASGDSQENLELPLFDFDTIAAATNHFSHTNKLGERGFGPANLTQEEFVAVKRISKDSGQGTEEFKNEVKMISNLQQWDLLKLLGCCIEGDERMQICPTIAWIASFSVCDSALHLPYQNRKVFLNWEKRLDVTTGIARGLLYLPQDSRLRIIHSDLKSSNILLDNELYPKISDFGIARIFGCKQTEAKTKRIIGT